MSKPSSKAPPTGYPEFAVRRESFDSYFDKPLPRSTFHDLVGKGIVVPLKGLKGFYKLNDSLRRMGLREVPSLPDVRRIDGRRAGHNYSRVRATVMTGLVEPASTSEMPASSGTRISSGEATAVLGLPVIGMALP